MGNGVHEVVKRQEECPLVATTGTPAGRHDTPNGTIKNEMKFKKVVYMMRALYSKLYGNSCIKILHIFSLFHGKKSIVTT